MQFFYFHSAIFLCSGELHLYARSMHTGRHSDDRLSTVYKSNLVGHWYLVGQLCCLLCVFTLSLVVAWNWLNKMTMYNVTITPFFPQLEIQKNFTSGAVIVKRKGDTSKCPTVCPIADGNSTWAQCCTHNGCNNLAIPSDVTTPAAMQQYYAGGNASECTGM